MPEDNTMVFDFKGVTPSTGRVGGDRIAPGTYLLEVKAMDKMATKDEKKPMVRATLAVANDGPAVGKKLVEYFVIAREGTDDAQVGLSRFLGLLMCLGMKEPKGKRTLDLTKLTGRRMVAEVDDEVVPARGEYKERIQSRMMAYFTTKSSEADNVGRTAAPAAPAPATQPTPAPAADDFAGEEPAEVAGTTNDDEDLFADLE